MTPTIRSEANSVGEQSGRVSAYGTPSTAGRLNPSAEILRYDVLRQHDAGPYRQGRPYRPDDCGFSSYTAVPNIAGTPRSGASRVSGGT